MSALPFPLPSRYEHSGGKLSGGQGVVFVCRDKFLGREVAIKSLHTVSNKAGLAKEIDGRAKIKSKHVAEIYDVLLDHKGEPIALVLEFVPGETLQDRSTIPSDLEGQLRLLYQMACGLAEIHDAGVIHRDIKPLNAKVDSAKVLKIFDLGIANLDADQASTIGGAGTYVYMAPELYKTSPIALTRAVDIYAFGAVAWHVLFANHPKVLLELPPQQSGAAVPSINSVVPNLYELGGMLDRALAVNPAIRPSAAELVAALKKRLTRGRRRGVFTFNGQNYELSAPGKVTSVKLGSLGQVDVAYDGNDFVVRSLSGSIYINNSLATIGAELPASCVLTFGDPGQGSARRFVSFNSSHPQIVI